MQAFHNKSSRFSLDSTGELNYSKNVLFNLLMSQNNNIPPSSKDELCEKLVELVVQKEKAEQHLVELENQAYTLEKEGKSK
jgi:hypothetical protein